MIETRSPIGFLDYQLIDSGDGRKMERFGRYTLIRPEPQAVWSPSLSNADWDLAAHAAFEQDGSSSGKWRRLREMPDQWYVRYQPDGMNLKFRLGLTRFKHVGIFPEQAVNWDYIHARCKALASGSGTPPKVLNLFAYTGGATLAAKSAGADVVHCDSIKQVVNWAAANMEASKLKDVRWLVEDAFKFVKREASRDRTYDGIILDPPAWGHGPKGEKWKLEDHINPLMEHVAKILTPGRSFLVFNAYSLGFSTLILENLVRSHFPGAPWAEMEKGELYLEEDGGRKLPAGIYLRFHR